MVFSLPFFFFFVFFFLISGFCRFDCLDEKDLPEVAKVLEDVELSASFEISFVGVKIVPNAKHPREIVSRVHLGKRPLQRLYEFVNHHHLLEKYRQQVPYVPLLKLAHFSDIKPALLEKEHILPLYFIEEIHRYRPDSIVLFDKDEKKAIMERKI